MELFYHHWRSEGECTRQSKYGQSRSRLLERIWTNITAPCRSHRAVIFHCPCDRVSKRQPSSCQLCCFLHGLLPISFTHCTPAAAAVKTLLPLWATPTVDTPFMGSFQQHIVSAVLASYDEWVVMNKWCFCYNTNTHFSYTPINYKGLSFPLILTHLMPSEAQQNECNWT